MVVNADKVVAEDGAGERQDDVCIGRLEDEIWDRLVQILRPDAEERKVMERVEFVSLDEYLQKDGGEVLTSEEIKMLAG